MPRPRSRREIERLLGELDHASADEIEGQHLDFKEWAAGSAREAVRSAVCMANGGGGTVVFGVRDKTRGRDRAIVGVPHAASVDRLRSQVYDGTDPKLTPVFEEVSVPEGTGRLILMHVHPGIRPYTDTAGRGTVSVGKDCKPLTGSIRRQVIEASVDADLTAETVDAPLADAFSAAAMEALRASAERERVPGELLGLSDRDLLKALGVVRDGMPTKAALLLAGSSATIRRHVPGHLWTCIRMASSTDYRDRADGTDSIPVALSRIVDRVMAHNPIETVRRGLYHHEHRTYPEVALRESLLNALCHSDFRIPSPRMVRVCDDRVEITSPGGFVGGVTAENILHHAPATRNAVLVDAMVRLRLVNRTNLGMDRIFRSLLVEGKSPPVVEDIGQAVRLTLRACKVSPSFRDFVAEESDRGVELNTDRLLVLHRLLRADALGLEEASVLCQRQESEVRVLLDEMDAELGYVERLGRSSSDVRWRLTPQVRTRLAGPLAAVRDPSADRERLKTKIVAVLRERARSEDPGLTNADVRRMTGLDRHRVRRVVGQLQEAGVVEVSGSGRGTRYVYAGER